ncbi:transposase [Streptomyces sp. NPDC059900]|uniref:transposase n=1 Tax=Streptomyces sp. NPDC059900 TaxID=3155816 RepID=UPI0034282908
MAGGRCSDHWCRQRSRAAALPSIGGRELIDVLVYWVRAGCAWRLVPHDFPLYQAVCHYWRQWRIEGRWEEILAALRARERTGQGREPTPSAGVVDSQRVKAHRVRWSARIRRRQEGPGYQAPPVGRHARPGLGGVRQSGQRERP